MTTADAEDLSTRSVHRLRGHLVLAATALACGFPIYWLVATSLRRPADQYSSAPLPWPLSVQNYVDAAGQTDVVRLLANTLAVAVASTVTQMLIALLASYAFAMYEFRLKRLLYLAFVGTWLVPFQVTMLPNYVLLHRLGMIDSLVGVVLPTMCSALAVLMMRQHMESFPKELVAAARMDGRSSWSILWTVVVPNLRPALAALSILLFITAWNEYFWPAVVLQRSNSVVQLGLRSFMTAEGTDWGAMMALAGITCVPVFVLYLALQRQIVNAFVRSGLK
ncbi:carbohydrate ABC transporter permease [Tsukamurella sp. 8F]|uniref:carbohydrate ABC transporter permease n=1 Tax=unclassified Tsukamurella TaxID=2633480 RepID=UPI0023B97B5B|nr:MULTISPECIES: carbohydrate ABC transporter permease [unclassified Tsukamurella]MDF0529505.1 carbohydrate ABC transporter permease [Tsukamurella sp. 8J]MDF0585807.1 carbohydrate ABC transporter permease [Tsukamurella sp. 8F]